MAMTDLIPWKKPSGALALRQREMDPFARMRQDIDQMFGDMLGSLGAVVAGGIIWLTAWTPADAVIALAMSVLILGREVLLILRSVDVLLESTPRHVDVTAFDAALRRVDAVREVHDLHIWTLTSGVYAMSCHALVGKGADHRRVLAELNAVIRERFGIEHTTIQLEELEEPQAALAPERSA